MNKLIVAGIVVSWLGIGALAGAGLNAHLRCQTFSYGMNRAKAREHLSFSMLAVTVGPAGFIAVMASYRVFLLWNFRCAAMNGARGEFRETCGGASSTREKQ